MDVAGLALSLVVVAIGLQGLWWAGRLTPERLDRERRRERSKRLWTAVLADWALSRLGLRFPLRAIQALYLALGLAILGFGVWAVVLALSGDLR